MKKNCDRVGKPAVENWAYFKRKFRYRRGVFKGVNCAIQEKLFLEAVP